MLNPMIVDAVRKELSKSGQIGGTAKEKLLPTADGGQSVPYGGRLIGLEVVDFFEGRRKANKELERPGFGSSNMCIIADDAGKTMGVIGYGDANGVLDKNCLMLVGLVAWAGCPTVAPGSNNYDVLIYAFEETGNTIGLPGAFPRGWYALNQSTFAIEPIDIDQCPIFVYEGMFGNFNYESEKVRAYVYECFPLREEIKYTVKEENIVKPEEENSVYVSWYPNFSFDAGDMDLFMQRYIYTSLEYQTDGMLYMDRLFPHAHNTTVYQPAIKPIDGKYLPEGGVGYTEGGNKETVVAEQSVIASYDSVSGESTIEVPASVPVSGGDELTVMWDGVKYSCVAVEVSGLVAIGNMGALGLGEHTGEPFLLVYDRQKNAIGGNVVSADNATHTIAIYKGGEVVHTIDPKYLPGLTLPVVELSEETATAMLGGGEPTLTDEEAAKFDSMLLTYAPFMLTVKMQGVVAGFCMCQYGLDFASFMPTYAGCMYYESDDGGVNLTGFRFRKTESGWTARTISGTV